MMLLLVTAFLILLFLILIEIYSVSSDMLSQVQSLESLLDIKYVNILTYIDLFKQSLDARFITFDEKFVILTEKLEVLKEFSQPNGVIKTDYTFYYFIILLTALGMMFLYINPGIILDLISSTCETSKVHNDDIRDEIAKRVINTIMKTSHNSNDLLIANQLSNKNCILESLKVQFDLQLAKANVNPASMVPVDRKVFWDGND